MPDIEEDLRTVATEIRRASKTNFSGDLKIDLQFRNGGISSISINLRRNLKGNGKKL